MEIIAYRWWGEGNVDVVSFFRVVTLAIYTPKEGGEKRLELGRGGCCELF